MFHSLNSRLLFSYIVIILVCLILVFCLFLVGYALMVYLLRIVGPDDKRFLKGILPSRLTREGE